MLQRVDGGDRSRFGKGSGVSFWGVGVSSKTSNDRGDQELLVVIHNIEDSQMILTILFYGV